MDQIPMKNQEITARNAQSGSIFIWIFVMIALFGALSYAMLQGSRGGGSTLTTERAKLAAQEVIEMGTLVRNTVKTLLLGGCLNTEISFEGGPSAGDYSNIDAPTDGSCDVFGAGGKLRAEKLGDGWGAERLVFGTNIVEAEGGTSQLGTVESDLTMIREVDSTTCGEINKLLGNPAEFWDGEAGKQVLYWESAGEHNGQRDPADDTWAVLVPFQGDYEASGGRGIRFRDGMEFNGTSFAGKHPPLSGCFCDSSTNCGPPVKYYYYNVLITR